MNRDEEAQFNLEVERGAQAERILKNPLVRDALELIESKVIEKWKTSPLADDKTQTMLRMQMHAIQLFRTYFEDAVQTGQLAATELDKDRTLKDRFRAGVREFRRTA